MFEIIGPHRFAPTLIRNRCSIVKVEYFKAVAEKLYCADAGWSRFYTRVPMGFQIYCSGYSIQYRMTVGLSGVTLFQDHHPYLASKTAPIKYLHCLELSLFVFVMDKIRGRSLFSRSFSLLVASLNKSF